MKHLDQETRSGLPYALGAHLIWGSMPVYLLLVRHVPALEYVAFRVLFTLPVCAALLFWRGDVAEVVTVLRSPRTMFTLFASALIVGLNWFLYVWAIQAGHVYAASLGYYILPLLMMLIGLVVLKEKLSRLQWVAVALAAVGVAVLASGALATLWLSLSMSVTFALYGYIRKTVAAGPLAGLTVETLLLTPVAMGVATWFAFSAEGIAFGRDGLETMGIIWGGVMTAVPLLMFATAARRMPYSIIGFLQFISPTILFFVGLFVFGEALNTAQLGCFIAIWSAAALFIWDMLRGKKPATDGAAPAA